MWSFLSGSEFVFFFAVRYLIIKRTVSVVTMKDNPIKKHERRHLTSHQSDSNLLLQKQKTHLSILYLVLFLYRYRIKNRYYYKKRIGKEKVWLLVNWSVILSKWKANWYSILILIHIITVYLTFLWTYARITTRNINY